MDKPVHIYTRTDTSPWTLRVVVHDRRMMDCIKSCVKITASHHNEHGAMRITEGPMEEM